MASYIERNRVSKEQIEEVKSYYRGEAMKSNQRENRYHVLGFLDYFDAFFEIQEGRAAFSHSRSHHESDSIPHVERHHVNQARGKIERYFKMKEKGPLCMK